MEEEQKKPILIESLGLQPNGNKGKLATKGIYECPFCNKHFIGVTSRIKSGNTKSCGCLQKLSIYLYSTKHGLRHTKLYEIWKSMKQRINNPKNKCYKYYGAKGLTVDMSWNDDFMSFREWSLANGYEEDKGLSIDRIDNDKGYSPDNCRWADTTTQARNQGMKKLNTSGFRGVHYVKKLDKYQARITINYVRISLGCYNTAVEAGIAYNNYIIENNLEGFNLNVIPEQKGETN